MWIIAIPIVLVVVFMVYNYVLLPKMNANADEKMAKASNDFASQIAGNEVEIKRQFIQENEHIRPIAFQINEQDIIAIISCQEKRGTNDFLRQQAVNMTGKALGRLTGVGVREVDNTEHYYLVLTSNHLHYLHYSDRGKCHEHLSFERSQLEHLEVGKVTSTDMLQNNAHIGLVERLSFESKGIQYKFFFYDKLYAHPSVRNHSFEDVAQLNHLFAKPFVAFVEPYRS